MQSVKISLIVLNWNGWQDTLTCLESLATVKNPPFNILVVDNGSTDGSQEKLGAFLTSFTAHPAQLIENTDNLGFAGGNNVGMRKALKNGAELIVLLNNDTKVEPTFLKELVTVVQKHHTIGMLNPKILHMDKGERTKRFWFIGGKINWLRTQGTHRDYNKEDSGQLDHKEFLPSEYATGCCVMVKRSVIEEIGLLSEDYFLYDEDVEWSLHARNAGWQCAVAPKAVIFHEGGSATGPGSPLYFRYHVRNGLLLSLKAAGLLTVVCAFLWSIPRAKWQAIKWLLFPEKRKIAHAILLGIRDAWLHRTGQIKE